MGKGFAKPVEKGRLEINTVLENAGATTMESQNTLNCFTMFMSLR